MNRTVVMNRRRFLDLVMLSVAAIGAGVCFWRRPAPVTSEARRPRVTPAKPQGGCTCVLRRTAATYNAPGREVRDVQDLQQMAEDLPPQSVNWIVEPVHPRGK